MNTDNQLITARLRIHSIQVRFRTILLLGASLLLAPPAYATCTKLTAAPVIPRGDASDAAQMKNGRDSVQNAVNLLQQYQTCLTKEIAAVVGPNSQQLKLAWAAEGDAAIDAAQQLAAQFSVQLRIFKAREKQGR